jgi:hypothetical protein
MEQNCKLFIDGVELFLHSLNEVIISCEDMGLVEKSMNSALLYEAQNYVHANQQKSLEQFVEWIKQNANDIANKNEQLFTKQVDGVGHIALLINKIISIRTILHSNHHVVIWEWLQHFLNLVKDYNF